MEVKYESHLTKSVFITNITKHNDGTLTASLQMTIYNRIGLPRTVVTISSPTLKGFQELGVKTALEVAAEEYGSRGTVDRVVSWLKNGGDVSLCKLYADIVGNVTGGNERFKKFYYEANLALIDALNLLPEHSSFVRY